jgi:hypothetical protein
MSVSDRSSMKCCRKYCGYGNNNGIIVVTERHDVSVLALLRKITYDCSKTVFPNLCETAAR